MVRVLAFLLLTTTWSCGASPGLDESYRTIDDDVATVPGPSYLALHSLGWASLPVEFRLGRELNRVQRAGIAQAIAIWNEAAGRTLARVSAEPAPKFAPDHPYGSLENGVNEIVGVRQWSRTGKTNVTLGTTIWDEDVSSRRLEEADVLLNTERYALTDATLARDPSAAEERVVDVTT